MIKAIKNNLSTMAIGIVLFVLVVCFFRDIYPNGFSIPVSLTGMVALPSMLIALLVPLSIMILEQTPKEHGYFSWERHVIIQFVAKMPHFFIAVLVIGIICIFKRDEPELVLFSQKQSAWQDVFAVVAIFAYIASIAAISRTLIRLYFWFTSVMEHGRKSQYREKIIREYIASLTSDDDILAFWDITWAEIKPSDPDQAFFMELFLECADILNEKDNENKKNAEILYCLENNKEETDYYYLFWGVIDDPIKRFNEDASVIKSISDVVSSIQYLENILPICEKKPENHPALSLMKSFFKYIKKQEEIYLYLWKLFETNNQKINLKNYQVISIILKFSLQRVSDIPKYILDAPESVLNISESVKRNNNYIKIEFVDKMLKKLLEITLNDFNTEFNYASVRDNVDFQDNVDFVNSKNDLKNNIIPNYGTFLYIIINPVLKEYYPKGQEYIVSFLFNEFSRIYDNKEDLIKKDYIIHIIHILYYSNKKRPNFTTNINFKSFPNTNTIRNIWINSYCNWFKNDLIEFIRLSNPNKNKIYPELSRRNPDFPNNRKDRNPISHSSYSRPIFGDRDKFFDIFHDIFIFENFLSSNIENSIIKHVCYYSIYREYCLPKYSKSNKINKEDIKLLLKIFNIFRNEEFINNCVEKMKYIENDGNEMKKIQKDPNRNERFEKLKEYLLLIQTYLQENPEKPL